MPELREDCRNIGTNADISADTVNNSRNIGAAEISAESNPQAIPAQPIHLTLKKRAQLKRVLSGERIGEASLNAGYSSASTGSRALKDTRHKLMEAMDRYCLTDAVLVRDYLLPLLNATATVYATFQGQISDTLPIEDNQVRLAALRETFKLRGAYPRDESGGPTHLNIAINNVSVVDKAEE